MIEVFFARTWIVIAASFIAALNYLAVWVVYVGVRHWRDELRKYIRVKPTDPAPSLDSSIWISSGVVMVIDVVILGGMDVGQFLQILLNNPEGLAWLCSAVLIPLIGGKAVTKLTSKQGSLEAQPNTTTTTTASTTSTTGGTP